jgi:hypothetical protein
MVIVSQIRMGPKNARVAMPATATHDWRSAMSSILKPAPTPAHPMLSMNHSNFDIG